jgi:hypothetical protein
MSDQTVTIIFLSIGCLLGIATIPWNKSYGDKNPILHIFMWAGIWPLLLLAIAHAAFILYRQAWREYLADGL